VAGGSPRPGMADALPRVAASKVPTSPAAATVEMVRWWFIDEVGRWTVVLVMRFPLFGGRECGLENTHGGAKTRPPHGEDS
jgi:hypothetical protein